MCCHSAALIQPGRLMASSKIFASGDVFCRLVRTPVSSLHPFNATLVLETLNCLPSNTWMPRPLPESLGLAEPLPPSTRRVYFFFVGFFASSLT